MKINIAVCGRFHYHNYVKYLDRSKVLNRFYYSHKVSTNSALLRVHRNRLVNIWIKEYLTRIHIFIAGYPNAERYFPIYHNLWESFALLNWDRCDVLHAMLHGTSRNLIRQAKSQGSIIVGEPVNSHPEYLHEILEREYENLGIARKLKLSASHIKSIQEQKECDYLLAASNFVKNSYIQKGFDRHKIHLIPYGVDLENFYPLVSKHASDRNAVFRVICVAQITPRKGHIYLLAAWKQLNLPNSELLLIGNLNDEMKPILAKYAGYFKHIPHVRSQELYKYYSQSSVFVLPSLEDGFSAVVPEAMACGLPAIVTENNGAAEIVDRGKSGFVVPIRTAEEIAKYLELLYTNPELRQEMSEAALAKSQTDLSWEQYAKRLCTFYKTIGVDRAI